MSALFAKTKSIFREKIQYSGGVDRGSIICNPSVYTCIMNQAELTVSNCMENPIGLKSQ